MAAPGDHAHAATCTGWQYGRPDLVACPLVQMDVGRWIPGPSEERERAECVCVCVCVCGAADLRCGLGQKHRPSRHLGAVGTTVGHIDDGRMDDG